MRIALVLVCTLVSGALGHAAEHASWPEYVKANRYKCPGPFDLLKTPRTVTLGDKLYTHTGYKLEVKNPDPDHTIKIGVVSAIKDVTSATKKNLADTIAWFKKEKVEWLVANGDLALEEFDLEEILDLLGQSGLPVLLVLGNSESKGSFARAYRDRMDKLPNLVNGVFVRQIIADDVEFWILPGYFDRRFVHQGAACGYREEDVEAMEDKLEPSGKAPVALVSHGPPRGKGRRAIDWVTAGQNVGDPLMTDLIKKKKIPFGLFGHILEAGGSANDKRFSSAVRPNKWVSSLYVNAGALSGDPWGMNDGSTSFGMAMLVTIDGKKAKYEVKRFENRIED